MNRFQKVFNSIAIYLLLGISLLAVLTFGITSFLVTYSLDGGAIQKDNIAISIVIIVFACLLALGGGRLLKFIRKRINWIDWVIVAVLVVIWEIYALFFLFGANELPGSDSKACLVLAERFLSLDYSAVVPTDSYLSLWPFQSGLILILEKTMRLFNTTDPLFFQVVNSLYCGLAFICGYGLLKEFTDKEEIIVAYYLIVFSDVVLPIECVVVYGNIPEFALTTFSAWMFVRLFKTDKKVLSLVWGTLGTIGLTAAGMYKSKAQIFAIALIICAIWLMINKKIIIPKVPIIVLAVILCFAGPRVSQKYYEHYAQNEMGKGVPAIAFVAMGLQDEGGWNGFHSNTYIETGYDRESTIEISKQSIKESLEAYKHNPLSAIRFFYVKTRNQWSNETRGAYWSVNRQWKEPRSEFSLNVIDGKLTSIIYNIANYRYTVLYFFLALSLLGCVAARIRRHDISILNYLGLIYMIGGLIFSAIWEAHTSYVLSYLHILIPFLLPSLCELIPSRGSKES